MMRKTNQKGFTLIELLVVIAIIGLLATLAVVSLNNARQRARDAKRKSDLNAIATAMELYNTENGSYPTFGTCGNNGVISGGTNGADSATAIDVICATGGIKDANNVYLQELPDPPRTSDTYDYEEGSASNNYCLSALLEKTGAGYFVCMDGSCFTRSSQCNEDGS